MLINLLTVGLVAFQVDLFQLVQKVKWRFFFRKFFFTVVNRAKFAGSQMLLNTLLAKVAAAINVKDRIENYTCAKLAGEEHSVGALWIVDRHFGAGES